MHFSQTLTVFVCWLLAVIIPPGGVVCTIRHHRAVERNDIGMLSSSSSSSSSSMTADDCRLPYDVGASNELVCAPAATAAAAVARRACSQLYTSVHSKRGTFDSTGAHRTTAPPRGSNCTYTFRGESNQRVRINIRDIIPVYGRARHRADAWSCTNSTNLSVFMLIDGAEVEIYSLTLCTSYPLESVRRKFLSSGPEMSVRLTNIGNEDLDFNVRGNYRFVTDFALGKRMNATQTAPGECIFCFHREPGQVLLSFEGEVVSPNHPGLYPRSTSCIYAFLASPGELVRLRFTQFNVEGIYPCLNWTQSDYVELSNNIRQTDRKYPRLCGNQRPHEEEEFIVSKSNFFRLTLVSNAIYDSTGFSAHYDFINKSVAHPVDDTREDGHVKAAKHLCDIAL